MKANTYVACVLLVFGLATRAFALAGDLTEPSLAFPSDFPESARTNIMAALRQPDCRFLGGHFVNWITSLNYGGDTKALNLFLEGLAKCPGIRLSVRFSSESSMMGCDWMIASHSSHEPYKIVVRVNLKSGQIKLEDLMIPDSGGPTLSEEK
jgi:hypothetical protein